MVRFPKPVNRNGTAGLLCDSTVTERPCATTVAACGATRRVRTYCTVSVGDLDWEPTKAFLARRKVTVCRTLAERQRAPWLEHDDVMDRRQPVDPVANGPSLVGMATHTENGRRQRVASEDELSGSRSASTRELTTGSPSTQAVVACRPQHSETN